MSNNILPTFFLDGMLKDTKNEVLTEVQYALHVQRNFDSTNVEDLPITEQIKDEKEGGSTLPVYDEDHNLCGNVTFTKEDTMKSFLAKCGECLPDCTFRLQLDVTDMSEDEIVKIMQQLKGRATLEYKTINVNDERDNDDK